MERFPGIGSTVFLVNSDTGEQIGPDFKVESWSYEPQYEVVESDFIGATATEYQSFFKGGQYNIKFQPGQAASFATLYNLAKAKGQGSVNTKIAATLFMESATGGRVRIVLQDMQVASSPVNMEKRAGFAKSDWTFNCSDPIIQVA